MEGYQQIFTVIIAIVLTITSVSGNDNLLICEKFKRNNGIHHIIETLRDKVPPCPCLRQQISLDYTFKKDGNCYSQWFSEDGVKQMCCYSDEGILHTGSPYGGYLLTDDFDMDLVKESCCSEVNMCQQFYTLNTSNNCSSYRLQETVTSWGDPVIQTIDGSTYDFNGHGEYVFLKTSNFEIQARTDYVTPGNFDSTLFSAFALYDKASGEQIELHLNRSTNDIIIYRKGERYCNIKRNDGKDFPHPCIEPPKYRCFILAGGGYVAIQGCGASDFAKQITISIAGGYMKMKITKKSNIESINITGLAGKLENGKLVSRKGTQISVNAFDYELFNISESWSLQNKQESRFYYINGGDFNKYNGYHTVPLFLEGLLGNLTALFISFSKEDITLFNKTCRNYWNDEPNEQCLLDIARNKNFSFGIAIMKEFNRTRKIWEIIHNKPPRFLDGMPTNISVAYKRDPNWILDLKEYVTDEHSDQLRFQVEDGFPNNEYTLENGIFNWTIGKELKNRTASLTFIAYDILNETGTYTISIKYCGCEQPSECNFDFILDSSTEKSFQRVSCQCLQYYNGEFCEILQDPCQDASHVCYKNLCNFTLPKPSSAGPSWPCLPCPYGTKDVLVNRSQQCNDINECLDEEICQHGVCNNTDGSYICTCYPGFELGSDENICKDIDECQDNTELCGVDQVCVNTEGNYTCICKSGFQLNTDSGHCEKISGKVYVTSMPFKIVIKNYQIIENVDRPENRKRMADMLLQIYQNVKGFISVEVIKLKITFGEQGLFKEHVVDFPYLNVQYILIWSDISNTTSIEKALVNANHLSSKLGPESIVIDGLQIIASKGVKVNTDICSVPEKVDCDTLSTICINTKDGYECKCKKGFEPFKAIKTECKDIDECDLFRRNYTMNDRCVHGKCLNTQGSWNCICPNDRQLQSVGNNSVAMLRCQGNYTYIGELSVLFDSERDDRQHVEQLILHKTRSIFANKTFMENGYYGVHISSLFVSISVLARDEKNLTTRSPDKSYSIKFKLRMGEAVETERLQTILDNLCDKRNPPLDATSVVLLQKCRMFNDSENILCSLTSRGGCHEQTTTCEQSRGKTYCNCKSGYQKHSEGDKFCRDINECNNKTYICYGGHCNNQLGNWSCTCQNNSFTPVKTNTNTITCTDFTEQHVNACTLNPTFECRGGEKVCDGNNWRCKCEKGAMEMFVSDMLTICQGEDECTSGSHTCSGHGSCRNLEHGYTCDCDAGYFINSTDPFNVACIDIGECSSADFICEGGKCTNIDGNWYCLCNGTGFKRYEVTPNFMICEDIDECHDKHYFCGGECFNYIGSWRCICSHGFQKISSENNTKILCKDYNECNRADACINGICENVDGSWNCLCHDRKKLKSINDTSKICSEEFHYVMTVDISSTASIQGIEDDLKLFLKEQIKAIYAAAFRGHDVQIGILSITTTNKRRKKRAAAENFKVKYIVHIDEETPSEELTMAWHNYIANCSKSCMINSKFPFAIIPSDDIAFESNTYGGLCVMKEYNHCDLDSTSCLYNNGTITCECNKGFSRKSYTSCKVSVDACKDDPCDNGGECVIVNEHDDSKRDFICKCEEGWTGRYCQYKQESHDAIKDSGTRTHTDSIFIAIGSTLGVLVIILLVIILVVCRMKHLKDKETKHLAKMLNERRRLRTHPRTTNIMTEDEYMYIDDSLRNSSAEMGRPSSFDPRRNLGLDRRQLSLQHESNRPSPPSPCPGCNNMNDRIYESVNSEHHYCQLGEFQANLGNNI